MRMVLPSLALVLLCLLQAGAEVPMQPDFSAEKFAGTWHLAAAASNCSVFLKMKDGMKSSIITISLTPEENLAMKLVWPILDKCQKFELLLQRSGQAGHYTVQEKRDVRVMDTDYSHYAIIYEVQHSNEKPRISLQLFMRGQDTSPKLLQKFIGLIPAMGLTQDMLVILPKSDQCTKAIS